MTLEERLALSFLEEQPPAAALVLERMPADHRAAVVRDARAAVAPALAEMLPSAVADCIARLEPRDASHAIDGLPIDRAVAALRRLPDEAALRAIDALPEAKQEQLRRVLRFPEGTAGDLMDPVVPELPGDVSVAEARVRLRRGVQGPLDSIFVVDRDRRLLGSLDISDLLRAPGRAPVRNIMRERVDGLPAWMPIAAVKTHPGWDVVHVLPVTDEAGRLVGAIRFQRLRRHERDQTGGSGQPATPAVGALGELFRLGLAGLIEGVAAAAVGGTGPSAAPARTEEDGR